MLVRGFSATVSDLYNLHVVPEGWRQHPTTRGAHGVRALALVSIVGQNTGVAALPSNVHRGRLPDGVLRSHADLAEWPLEDAADDLR